MPADDVQLPDLEVIQRFSLAVRGATAPRAEVVAALQADLAWLTGEGAASRSAPAATPVRAPRKGAAQPSTPPRKRAARRPVPASQPTVDSGTDAPASDTQA